MLRRLPYFKNLAPFPFTLKLYVELFQQIYVDDNLAGAFATRYKAFGKSSTASIAMTENRLLVGHGTHASDPSFMQQGQVDWVSFGKTVYQASFAVLQRLAAAGVQPVTHGGGLALAHRKHPAFTCQKSAGGGCTKLSVAFDHIRVSNPLFSLGSDTKALSGY